MSHQELADMIAAYRETVKNALDELETRGYVKLSRRSIEVLDRGALEKLAAKDPEASAPVLPEPLMQKDAVRSASL